MSSATAPPPIWSNSQFRNAQYGPNRASFNERYGTAATKKNVTAMSAAIARWPARLAPVNAGGGDTHDGFPELLMEIAARVSVPGSAADLIARP